MAHSGSISKDFKSNRGFAEDEVFLLSELSEHNPLHVNFDPGSEALHFPMTTQRRITLSEETGDLCSRTELHWPHIRLWKIARMSLLHETCVTLRSLYDTCVSIEPIETEPRLR